MKYKLSLAGLLLAGFVSYGAAQSQYQYPFQNPTLAVEQRINDLLGRMTLDEKIACLGTDPEVPRLGVKGTGHVEGLHGLALGGPGHQQGARGLLPIPTTQFPQSRGLGQTWDAELIRQVAAVEGYETRYAFQSAKYHRGGLVVRAPNADLSRDPRWGRGEESYGEDPYLVGTFTVAFVKGLQGDDPKYWLTASLMKHFLANSNEDGRSSSSSDFDTRLFNEYYSVPFRMGIEEGGSQAFMTSYNQWNHIPMTAQPVLKDVVEKDWGFDGIICTDAGALRNLVGAQKYSPDMSHAAASAIHAGINQFLDRYEEAVRLSYQQKLITDSDLDENLRGVFRVMIHLGLLDPPAMVSYSQIGAGQDAAKGDPWDRPENHALARRATDESIVLLKNDSHALPLTPEHLKSIAVIGPYADRVVLDWYSGSLPYSVSPLDGIKKRVGDGTKVTFSNGQDAAATAQIAHDADIAIVIVGNHPTCNAMWAKCPLPSDGKEAIDRKSITLEQEELVKQVYAANPHTIVALIASFPFDINWTNTNIPAIVEMTHSSEEEGNGLADVLFGDYNPAGRLTQTWPASIDQLPPMMDYDIRNGRTYMYFKGKPLYAFGYGLSYTTFKYSDLTFSSQRLTGGKDITVSLRVKNTGAKAGDEVVQLYVTHLGSKVARPIKELKGFARVSLRPNETKIVSIPLKASSLAYWDEATHKFVVEPESVRVVVGGSSDSALLQAELAVAP